MKRMRTVGLVFGWFGVALVVVNAVALVRGWGDPVVFVIGIMVGALCAIVNFNLAAFWKPLP